jgi:hypothetical protein
LDSDEEGTQKKSLVGGNFHRDSESKHSFQSRKKMHQSNGIHIKMALFFPGKELHKYTSPQLENGCIQSWTHSQSVL